MTKNFAHRGFSGKFPENTILAFQKAIEAGADGIELDVQMTKDKELVIIHDETINRTCNGKGYVSDYTLKELQEFDASFTFRGQYGSQRIPTLREYLELVSRTQTVTNIELKTGINPYPGIEEKTVRLINEYKLNDRIIFSSFNHYSVKRCLELCPEIPCGFLEESRIIGFCEYAKKHGMTFVHPEYHMITESFIKEALSNGVRINAWTVNTEEDMNRLIKNDINAVITNHPDICRKILEKQKQSVSD